MFKKILLPILFTLVYSLPVVADESLNDEQIGDFKLGLSETELKNKVNCPVTTGKEEMWGADGLYHQVWDYPACGFSFGMSSAQAGGSKTVDSITVTAPNTLKTKRGIQIGSTEQEVTKAYGAEKDAQASVTKEVFVAGSVYGGVFFNFKNERVTSIFIGAGAE